MLCYKIKINDVIIKIAECRMLIFNSYTFFKQELFVSVTAETQTSSSDNISLTSGLQVISNTAV